MKLYRVEHTVTGADAPSVQWLGSEAECTSHRKTIVAAGTKRADIETETIDIPTDKKGLLAWLNENGV